jgi:hypothetical protein
MLRTFDDWWKGRFLGRRRRNPSSETVADDGDGTNEGFAVYESVDCSRLLIGCVISGKLVADFFLLKDDLNP